MGIQIALGDRLRVTGRAVRALFKQPTSQDILGVFAGLFPGVVRDTRRLAPSQSLSRASATCRG